MNVKTICSGAFYHDDYSYRDDSVSGDHMLLLTRSRARLDTGERSVTVPGDTLILWSGSCPYGFGAADEYLLCDWICFDPEGDKEFAEMFSVPLDEPLMNVDGEMISQLIRSISEEFYTINARRSKMLETMMRIVLMKAGESRNVRADAQSASDPHYRLLEELRGKIYRNPQLKWNVDAMAADVNMSRSYFQHIYSEVFGVSCINDVINSKIEKAKELLTETSCTVSQISAMCGYDNEEHFMRQFKKIVGKTPTGYRKK